MTRGCHIGLYSYREWLLSSGFKDQGEEWQKLAHRCPAQIFFLEAFSIPSSENNIFLHKAFMKLLFCVTFNMLSFIALVDVHELTSSLGDVLVLLRGRLPKLSYILNKAALPFHLSMGFIFQISCASFLIWYNFDIYACVQFSCDFTRCGRQNGWIEGSRSWNFFLWIPISPLVRTLGSFYTHWSYFLICQWKLLLFCRIVERIQWDFVFGNCSVM